MKITHERLREVLHYEEETGHFKWKIYIAGTSGIGNKAGSLENTGYFRIQIDGRRYQSSVLVWFYMTGHFPEYPREIVDHENRDTKDNRWSNLRLTSYDKNVANSKLYSTNTSGYRGVFWHKRSNKWTAAIRVKNKLLYLGSFDDKHEAALAYEREAKKYFGDFATTNEGLL